MDPRFTVRPFRDADAEPLTELLHAAYAELGAAGLNFTAVDQDAETTRYRAGKGECLVVLRDAQFIGTVTMSLPPSDSLKAMTPEARVDGRAWLNQLAVAPSARGLGIACDLWRRGRAWAAEQGATSIGVDTASPAENLLAIYRSWGFTEVDSIHWPGKTYDSAVMVRWITAEGRP